jgi:hypothetical protein
LSDLRRLLPVVALGAGLLALSRRRQPREAAAGLPM